MECRLAMILFPGEPAPQPKQRRVRSLPFAIVLLVLLSLPPTIPPSLFAGPFAAPQAANQPQDELGKRLKAASAARDSHDQAAVELANERLIAQAFREMAQLQLVVKDYPQAIDR